MYFDQEWTGMDMSGEWTGMGCFGGWNGMRSGGLGLGCVGVVLLSGVGEQDEGGLGAFLGFVRADLFCGFGRGRRRTGGLDARETPFQAEEEARAVRSASRWTQLRDGRMLE